MKKIVLGLIAVFALMVFTSNVFAGGGRHGGPGNGGPPLAPEPMSYLLLAAGGSTLAGVRYWMAKRRSKKDAESSSEVEN